MASRDPAAGEAALRQIAADMHDQAALIDRPPFHKAHPETLAEAQERVSKGQPLDPKHEAALMDNANEFQLLFRVYLPMNWAVTTALAIITFIGAWNAFLWPFLAVTSESQMTIAVGITQVQDAFGVHYARDLAGAMMAGLPVAIAYLIFQRRVTQAITLSAGIKG